MEMRIKAFKVVFIIISIIIVLLLTVGIYLHVSDLIAMRECASQEDCMYCIPTRMIIAYIIYAICFILLNIDALFIILFFTVKKEAKMYK